MTHAFEQDLTQLRRRFTAHTASCLEALERAREVLRRGDPELADSVLRTEDAVDRVEVALEEECVRLITLHHPVAHDMRLLITMIKLNDELERIADHSANVCRLAVRITRRGDRLPPELFDLADRVCAAAGDAFQAWVDQDAQRAGDVVRGDAEADRLERVVHEAVHDRLQRDGDIQSGLDTSRMARELERVGDHLANMAEDVIYLRTGEIVRHRAPA
ncbi:MAG: phosphate signaling complex protein PhoU [Planctomycetota bacterium]|jgi:phosphate transport system protein